MPEIVHQPLLRAKEQQRETETQGVQLITPGLKVDLKILTYAGLGQLATTACFLFFSRCTKFEALVVALRSGRQTQEVLEKHRS